MSRPELLGAVALLASGCRTGMHDQPRHEPYEGSVLFADGAATRMPPEGTVPRGARLDEEKPEGDGLPADISLDRRLVERGRERYEIFCSPCHDSTGAGRGMVVERGFDPPPTFHQPRLRRAPLAYFVGVIDDGYGVMMSYRARVAPHDRWAIAAYIRTLQLSQHAPVASLDPRDQSRLRGETP